MEMIENRDLVRGTGPRPWEGPEGFLNEAYGAHRQRFAAQPSETQQSVEAEAAQLGALLSKTEIVWHAGFLLPERVAVGHDNEVRQITAERRPQHVGTWLDRLRGRGLRTTLRSHLVKLEQSSDRSVATGAKLIRHATAVWIIQHVGEFHFETRPALDGSESSPEASATLGANPSGQASDLPGDDGQDAPALAWVVSGREEVDAGPYFVPEWMAFDAQDRLVVDSEAQAESYLGLLQESLAALRAAISLAAYMVADEVYQVKRAGLLVQLAEQGRALARYQTREVNAVLLQRTAGGQLNRGLKVSLPYYDDQALDLKLRTFDIIPAGRIMYVPALGVRAVQDEQAKVAQDTRLSSATRDHLLEELEMLMRAFRGPVANSVHA
jgi:hypothetical protein